MPPPSSDIPPIRHAADQIGSQQPLGVISGAHPLCLRGERGKCARPLPRGCDGIAKCYCPERYCCTGRTLRQTIKIRGYDSRDLWIAAGCLTVTHQHDGPPVARHLHAAWHHPVRDDVMPARGIEPWTVKDQSHPVGPLCDAIATAQKGIDGVAREMIILWTGDDPKRPVRKRCRRREPEKGSRAILRHAGKPDTCA